MAKSVAILTIGSLFWSTKAYRVKWRSERLAVKDATRVHAPIRYGRHSTRSGYTMVFSTGLPKEQVGWALAVPCLAVVDTFDQLIEEAEALWAAEQKDPSCKLAASWGAVGLLSNPNRTGLDHLTAQWSARVATEHDIYKQFPSVDGEVTAVTPSGLLAIPWPLTESGTPLEVDFLLATPTVPRDLDKNCAYVSPQEIASAFQGATDGRRYFDETRKVGISTAFDVGILHYLESTGKNGEGVGSNSMANRMTRDRMVEAIRELPADATVDDAIERLVFLAKIEEGLAQLDRGEGVPHEEVKRRLGL